MDSLDTPLPLAGAFRICTCLRAHARRNHAALFFRDSVSHPLCAPRSPLAVYFVFIFLAKLVSDTPRRSEKATADATANALAIISGRTRHDGIDQQGAESLLYLRTLGHGAAAASPVAPSRGFAASPISPMRVPVLFSPLAVPFREAAASAALRCTPEEFAARFEVAHAIGRVLPPCSTCVTSMLFCICICICIHKYILYLYLYSYLLLPARRAAADACLLARARCINFCGAWRRCGHAVLCARGGGPCHGTPRRGEGRFRGATACASCAMPPSCCTFSRNIGRGTCWHNVSDVDRQCGGRP